MINAIFAVDSNGGMGVNGTLPWPHCSADLANFKQLTKNHVVVMGRKTWDDPKMPKPLPGRTVYVASHQPVSYAGHVTGDLLTILPDLEQRHSDKIIWVIGGSAILEQCSKLYTRIYLTSMPGSYKVDTRIQIKTLLSGFRAISARKPLNANCTFITYENLFKFPTASS